MTIDSPTAWRAINIFDTVCTGLQHAPFNASMLEIVALALPETPITFFAQDGHIDEVRRMLGHETRTRVRWVPVTIPAETAGFSRRLVNELRLLRTLGRVSGSGGGTLVLILTALESTIAAIKVLHSFDVHFPPVQAVLHGYLNRIVGWRSRNPWIRATSLRSIMSLWTDSKLRYVVLEEPIRRQLLLLLPGLKGQVDWISHPFPPAETHGSPETPGSPVRIGFLGLATREKGFDVFLRLAEQVKKIHGDRVEFHALGRMPSGTAIPRSDYLTTLPTTVSLPRDDYVRSVRSLHYVCLPYQGGYYELSPSGVLLDAVAFLKPIVALPSPVLRALFAREPQIGFLCESPEELTQLVSRLPEMMDRDRYQSFVEALRALREKRSPARLAPVYRLLAGALM